MKNKCWILHHCVLFSMYIIVYQFVEPKDNVAGNEEWRRDDLQVGLLTSSSRPIAPVVHLLSLLLLNNHWLVLPWTTITKLPFSHHKGGMTSDIVFSQGPAQCEINCRLFRWVLFHFVYNRIHVAFMSRRNRLTSSGHREIPVSRSSKFHRWNEMLQVVCGASCQCAVIGVNAAMTSSVNFANVLNKSRMQRQHQVCYVEISPQKKQQ